MHTSSGETYETRYYAEINKKMLTYKSVFGISFSLSNEVCNSCS